jgi:hypothetical protein
MPPSSGLSDPRENRRTFGNVQTLCPERSVTPQKSHAHPR